MMRVAATVAVALLSLLWPTVAAAQGGACRDRLPTDLTTIELRSADVQTTLRVLAERYRVSLIVTPDVTGTVTVSLYDIPVREAFDALLNTGGLACVTRDGILVVSPRDRLQKEAQAAREAARREEEERAKAEQARLAAETEARRRQAEALREELLLKEIQARGPLREETIRLRYADPEELARTLGGILGIAVAAPGAPPAPPGPGAIVPPLPPFSAVYGTASGAVPPPPVPAEPVPALLGQGLTIRPHRPTHSIFLRLYERDLESIRKLIVERFDVPVPQVKIEARLSEVSRTALSEIGVQWGGAGSGRDGRHTLIASGVATGPQQAIHTDQAFPVNPLAATLAASPIPGLGDLLPFGANLVNLPTLNAPAAALGFGIIGTRFSLNLALQALEAQQKARSLSRPEIVTLENSTATISLGSRVPYSTVSAAGTQVQFNDALLSLEVRPVVIREPDGTNRIMMRVNVTDNSLGALVQTATGPQPTINQRQASTEVIVREGESLVIGGIGQVRHQEQERKVPVLGDVPILGWLFKAKTVQTVPSLELVVFITPTVVRDAAARPVPGAPATR